MNIKQLILIKVGDKDHPATEQQVKDLEQLFAKKDFDHTKIVWNHTIQVSVESFDVDKVDGILILKEKNNESVKDGKE